MPSPFDAAKAQALRFFSEEPWWIDNMVRSMLKAANDAEQEVLVRNQPIYDLIDRMTEGMEPAKESLADYVLVRKNWVVSAGGRRITYRAFSHEEIDREVQRLGELHPEANVYIAWESR